MDIPSYLLGRRSGGSGGATIEVVTELPTTGESNVIYLVPKQTAGQDDVFDEYIYVNDDWELIGSTAIDISGKQDTMQFSTMPTADSTTVGKIIQYVGTTNANYTNGYFYIGTTDGAATYGWSNINVQAGLATIEHPVYILSDTTFDISGSGYSKTYTDAALVSFVEKAKQGTGLLIIHGQNHVNAYITIAGTWNSGFIDRGSNNTMLGFDPTITLNQESGVNVSVTINSGYGTKRTYLSYTTTNNYLTTNNTASYTVSGDYNPAHKQYVDRTSNKTVLQQSGLSAYSTSTTYQEGDYVYRSSSDFTIYKCNTADTTGTWNASKWTQKTYMEYLNDKLVGGALNGSY